MVTKISGLLKSIIFGQAVPVPLHVHFHFFVCQKFEGKYVINFQPNPFHHAYILEELIIITHEFLVLFPLLFQLLIFN